MKKIRKYIKIWIMITTRVAQIAFVSRSGFFIFLIGKILRYTFFLLFLILLISKTQTIAGYSLWQVIFLYVSFNIVDTLSQFLFREVYRFRTYIVNGEFDLILAKPISPLFRSLFGGSDIIDFPILILSIIFLFYAGGKIGDISIFSTIIYISLLLNAFLISLSFHVFVLSIGVMTTEIDNTIMLYRDITSMGRIPIEIYLQPLRSILTFVIPVGIMMTFPTKALLGLLSWQFILISYFMGIFLLSSSLYFWKYSLNKYSSASS